MSAEGIVKSVTLSGTYEHAELYRMAFAACPSGFIVENNQSRVVDWNPAAERIFGWTKAEARGQPSPHFLVPKEVWPSIEGIFAQLLETAESTDSLNDNVTKEGNVIQCEEQQKVGGIRPPSSWQ